MKVEHSAIAIDVKNLRVRIGGADILGGVDFALSGSEAVAVVGESGSGKTMLVRSLIGLLPPGASPTGDYSVDGAPFSLSSRETAWRELRGSGIGMIMQDPFTALDPSRRCGKQILDGVPKPRRKGFDIDQSLAEVGLSADMAERYPFQLSGGQRQRVVIAAALATEPRLLIADEATTALDVITQKEIMDLIDAIRLRRGMPIIIITHNMRLAMQRTSRIFVMDGGRIVESGSTDEITRHPKTDYAKALLDADRYLTDMPYAAHEDSGKLILSVKGLTKRFGGVAVVDDVSLDVRAGECVGIVGQSGSGKTTLARCVAGLAAADAGSIEYTGSGHPQMVFQDPYSSLNPAHTIRFILEEALHASGRPKGELDEIVSLAEVPPELLDRKPAKLSGGQRQRIAIARALAPRSDLLICDESVSALDLIVQNQILTTLDRLRKERRLSILFITHDLSVLRMVASRVYVMHQAKIVESGPCEAIFASPADEYTKQLIEASRF